MPRYIAFCFPATEGKPWLFYYADGVTASAAVAWWFVKFMAYLMKFAP